MKNNNILNGFSLLEILVALAIFSVVSVTMHYQISSIISTSTRIEEKYYALWVGKNILENYFIKREWPALGEDITEYEMAGQEWYVKTLISSSNDNADIRILEASVYKNKFDESPIIVLYRIIGKN